MDQMTPRGGVVTLCEAFQRTISAHGDRVALRTKGGATTITWQEYGDSVVRYAAGLAGLGVRAGDAVALLLANRPEFNVLDTAAMHLGAVCFSIYPTSAPEQMRYLLSDSGARVVITEPAFVERLREAVEGTGVSHIVLVEGSAAGTLSLAELEAAASPGFDFESAWQSVTPASLLTIIYTSGTTGPPKGVELTHANMVAELEAWHAVYPAGENARAVSYLPHAHVADRMGSHYRAMHEGITVTTCPDPRLLFEHLPDAQPTEFGGVPRVWEKLRAALTARFAGEPPEQRARIDMAIAAGIERVQAEQAGEPVPEAILRTVETAEVELFAPLRKALGFGSGQRYASGAAPIAREVLEFFHAIGIPIAEVWGMSELSCVATAMPPGRTKIGSVGKALPGVELAIAGDGEVLVRGAMVMRGYRNQPEKTAETIDRDGWLATGDIGELDAEGFLRIVDRKKELIINAAGKNMSPSNIEARIKTSSPLIGQACAIGDGRPYNVALLVLDPDGAAAFARARGLEPSLARLVEEEAVQAEIARAVEEANGHLSRVEQIKRFELLADEWLPGGDELTPTMKLKRKPIARKYEKVIGALYGAER